MKGVLEQGDEVGVLELLERSHRVGATDMKVQKQEGQGRNTRLARALSSHWQNQLAARRQGSQTAQSKGGVSPPGPREGWREVEDGSGDSASEEDTQRGVSLGPL